MFRKISNVLMISGILLAGVSCDKNDDPEKKPGENENPDVSVVNLSEKEMANCYIVEGSGSYMFKADNQFNLGEGLPVPPKISPTKAVLVWQTEKGSIGNVDLEFVKDIPYVKFEVNKSEGNALIAVCDSEDNILWSWHIWMPLEKIETVTTVDGTEIMSMNLGALNNTPGDVKSYGLLYQWGRKDPFPASPNLLGDTSTVSAPMYDINGNEIKIQNSSWSDLENNTLEYSISHPTICLSNYAQYASSRDWLKADQSDDSLWGNPNGFEKDQSTDKLNKGRKTCYDPSPAGWRVADPDTFSSFTYSGGYTWEPSEFNVKDMNGDGVIDINDYNYGWHFLMSSENYLYFPAASRFDGSYAMLMGSMSGLWGNYWSNSPSSTISGGAVCGLAFQVKDQTGNDVLTISPAAASSRADAFSIRCVKE